METFLENVLNESLRLYPPTWLFVRIASAADMLPSGASTTPGGKIYICPYTLHRTVRYFSQPEQFMPERFSSSTAPAAFIPFGKGAEWWRHCWGPRRCIGEGIAYLEARLVIGEVLKRFSLHVRDSAPVRPYPGVTLRPAAPLRLTLRKI